MSQVATKPFGTIEVDPLQIISFPDGLMGFPEASEFALLDDRDESPFKWLQSTLDESLAFVVIQPELFLESYVPEPASSDLRALEVESVSELLVVLIVTIPENEPQKMTANLQGPILINRHSKIGRQVISNNDGHTVRVSILEQLEG